MVNKNYKRLGDYIQRLNNRNQDLVTTELLGINIDKYFMPSVANIIGTDLSRYKLVEKNQFACNRMHVGRDDRIPIALSKREDSFIVSPAYDVFEITKPQELSHEYLMMWVSRKEFDREVTFYTDADVRAGLKWESLEDIRLPIPSIEKQREIVAEYQSIENKIKVNEQICEKLEEAAQALYRHWFVDFEFPNEEGLPYKSSGGEMVWNEEMEKEVPRGWEVKSFTEVFNLTGGGTPRTQNSKYWDGYIPFFTPADITNRYYSISTIKYITELGLKESSTKLYPKNTVFITARGTVGSVGMAGCNMAMNQSCYAVNDEYPLFTHQSILYVINELKRKAVGAVFSALVTKDFEQQMVLNPSVDLKRLFNYDVSEVYSLLLNKSKINQKSMQLQSLLLARLAKL